MSNKIQDEANTYAQFAALTVYNVSDVLGTFTGIESDMYRVCADRDIYVNRGLGPVLVTDGSFVPLGAFDYFNAKIGATSYSWASADGNPVRVTIAVISR